MPCGGQENKFVSLSHTIYNYFSCDTISAESRGAWPEVEFAPFQQVFSEEEGKWEVYGIELDLRENWDCTYYISSLERAREMRNARPSQIRAADNTEVHELGTIPTV